VNATDAAIRFDAVGKCFDDTWVLEDVDLEIPTGTIIGMIGPSGSGKTTMVRLMNGVYGADAGEVRVLGGDPTERPLSERTEIGYLPQQPVLFQPLSLWENLNFHASLNGVRFRRRARLRTLLDLVELTGHERKLVSESSGGMQRRLALAATLVHEPPLLMLDEPTAGIDPILRRRFWEYFRAQRDEGTTLVVTTQFVDEAAHCDVVAMLAEGRVMAVGTPSELRRRAFGGDLVDVEFDRTVGGRMIERCHDVDGVVHAAVVDGALVRLTIEPAGRRLPDILEELATFDYDVVGSSEVAVNWDEVFIALVGDDDPDASDADTDGDNGADSDAEGERT
jgi:ABC-2 type transport system ATP-binding protein